MKRAFLYRVVILLFQYGKVTLNESCCTEWKFHDVVICSCRQVTWSPIVLIVHRGIDFLTPAIEDLNFCARIEIKTFNEECAIELVSVWCEYVWNFEITNIRCNNEGCA